MFLRFHLNPAELDFPSLAPQSHRTISIFLNDRLLCFDCLFDLIELPVMGKCKVVTDCPLCFDAENSLEVQPLGNHSMKVPWRGQALDYGI